MDRCELWTSSTSASSFLSPIRSAITYRQCLWHKQHRAGFKALVEATAVVMNLHSLRISWRDCHNVIISNSQILYSPISAYPFTDQAQHRKTKPPAWKRWLDHSLFGPRSATTFQLETRHWKWLVLSIMLVLVGPDTKSKPLCWRLYLVPSSIVFTMRG